VKIVRQRHSFLKIAAVSSLLFGSACATVAIESPDNAGVYAGSGSSLQRAQQGNSPTATPAAPITQVRSERMQGMRFLHYACADSSEETERRFRDQSFVEFGVAHTFGETAVQPYVAYRCD
jgi:hypothetical protein